MKSAPAFPPHGTFPAHEGQKVDHGATFSIFLTCRQHIPSHSWLATIPALWVDDERRDRWVRHQARSVRMPPDVWMWLMAGYFDPAIESKIIFTHDAGGSLEVMAMVDCVLPGATCAMCAEGVQAAFAELLAWCFWCVFRNPLTLFSSRYSILISSTSSIHCQWYSTSCPYFIGWCILSFIINSFFTNKVCVHVL